MSAGQTAIAIATPLASALIAGVVALLVTRRQRRNALETWVLDRRSELYVELLDALHELAGSPFVDDRAVALNDAVKIRALTRLLHRADLIAPQSVIEKGRPIYELCWTPIRDAKSQDNFVAKVNELLDELHGALVPQHMR